MSRFAGHRTIWMWDTDPGHQAERTAAEVAGTARWYADSDIVLLKVASGQSWQGNVPGVPPGYITDLASWYAWHDALRALGIQAIPWVEPHTPADAAFHASINPVIVADLEPTDNGQDFWTAGNVADYVRAMQASNVEVWASIDARPAAWNALNAGSWLPNVAGVMPQQYWTTFQQEPRMVLPDLANCLLQGPPVVPVLPADANRIDMEDYWSWAQGMGAEAPSLWRLGTAGIGALRSFSWLSTTGRQVLR